MKHVRVLAKEQLAPGEIQVGPHIEALTREEAQSMSLREMLDRRTVYVAPGHVQEMRDYIRDHPEMELVE